MLKNLLTLAKLRIVLSVGFTGIVGYMASRTVLDTEKAGVFIFVLLLSGVASAFINSLLDYTYDKKMERTLPRIQAIDAIGKEVLWGISFILLAVSLFFTALFFTLGTLLLLILTVLSYVVLYTLFLKRKSPFGVVLGGLPGALPLLMGYSLSEKEFSPLIWILFSFMMLWQPPHFWALTLKIKEDYKQAKIPVLPLVYDNQITKLYIYIYALPLLVLTMATCYITDAGPAVYSLILSINIYYFGVTFYTLEKSHNYDRAFKSSLVYMMAYMLTFFFHFI